MNSDSVRKNYKKSWSDYRTWEKREHATKQLVYPQNLTQHIAIDELTLSRGELYTYITSKDKKQRKGVLIGSVQGTKAANIIAAFEQIPLQEREKVKEISLDMAANMHLAASTLFPKSRLVTDRFHVVKLILEALQKIRIDYRWEAIALENKQIKECRRRKIPFQPEKMKNGETRKEMLARSRFLLFKIRKSWTEDQKTRASALFRVYPKLREAYRMTLRFRAIYEQTDKEIAARKFRLWINQIKTYKMEAFNSAANSVQYHLPTILNFFHNRSTNAHAESFNAKIKGFRANLRGVSNPLFFLFRLEKLFA